NIGLGTDAPVVKLHIADGNSPVLRIEQDASSGFTPQIWDIAGNEANFFIRDVTNGSTLPFRIKPGAPQNALFIAANGNIGLGTATPNANASLELKSVNKGFLLNRLTTLEKTTLQSLLVAEDIGLMVYDTDIKGLFSWDGTQWISGVNTDAQDLALTTNTLSLTNDGTTVDLSGYLDNTDAQDLSLSTNTLSLTNDGTAVDLSGYLDNIDAQTVSLTGTTLAISNGNNVDLSSLQDGIGTDAQDLTLSTNTLSLTNDGTAVDLSGYLDNTDAQTVSLTGTTLAISNGNTLNLSSLQDGIGTDAQDLSLSTNTLSLTNDGTAVDLSGYLDNTDAQTVSLTGTTLAISNGNNVDLSSLQDGIGTDAQDLTLSTNTLSLTNDGTTVDLSGYLDNTDAQDLTLSTNTLSLTNDGTPVDLSGYLDNTDAQTVSLTGTTFAISNGNTLNLSSLQDGIGTDAQDLSLSTNTLSLTNDGTPVDLSGYLDNTDAQTVSLTGTTFAISNGNNVDLSSLQDGIGTDAQDLTSAVLSGNVLEIEIENGNSVSVDLSPVLSSLQAEINTQSEMITALVARIEAIEACACGGTLAVEGIQNKNSNFKLSQNKPNPFNGETKIDFKIPSDIQKAYIKIYDSNGKTLQKIAITQRGEGSITYDNDRFSSGLYYYSLFADNIKVDTKRMLLNNK
ncbi:MAG: GH25 family lysozyme M1 (1,4-beta-N-acetylmuramidase), partial [Polaribacter sp.]